RGSRQLSQIRRIARARPGTVREALRRRHALGEALCGGDTERREDLLCARDLTRWHGRARHALRSTIRPLARRRIDLSVAPLYRAAGSVVPFKATASVPCIAKGRATLRPTLFVGTAERTPPTKPVGGDFHSMPA